MAINKYFSDGTGIGSTGEQNLLESNIIEMIQLAGQDFFYIPRKLVKVDNTLNEDPLSRFEKYFPIEMYCTNTQDYGGQGHLLTPFGLQVNDTIELLVAKKRFFEETGYDAALGLEGDLIYWPFMQSVWQIDFMEEEKSPFYALSNIYLFSLKCSRYTFSYEDFETGIPEVDGQLNQTAYKTPFEKNDTINDTADPLLDFTENNPFGEISSPPDSNS